MHTTLNIELTHAQREELEKLAQGEGVPVDQLIEGWVKRALVLRRFRAIQQRVSPHARAAGFETDEDVFRAFS